MFLRVSAHQKNLKPSKINKSAQAPVRENFDPQNMLASQYLSENLSILYIFSIIALNTSRGLS